MVGEAGEGVGGGGFAAQDALAEAGGDKAGADGGGRLVKREAALAADHYGDGGGGGVVCKDSLDGAGTVTLVAEEREVGRCRITDSGLEIDRGGHLGKNGAAALLCRLLGYACKARALLFGLL